MAKKVSNKSMEETLWDSANKLRGTVESSEYKHVVLSLIFLKFASDKFEERRKELINEGKDKFLEMVEFYTMKNVFFLPEESRWSHIIKNSKQDNIALIIDTALHTTEKNNPSLKGALPDNYQSMADLMEARVINQQKPILRKDFIVDGFQIVEAKAIGADVILLIAACLTSEELKNYGNLATDLGLEVLYEVHTQEDLDKINDLDNKIIGINNRNLNTFEVDLENSIKLSNQIPNSSLKISESGISDPKIIMGLKEYGFQGFLIGETFMKQENPGEACLEFISQIR